MTTRNIILFYDLITETYYNSFIRNAVIRSTGAQPLEKPYKGLKKYAKFFLENIRLVRLAC